MKRLTCISPGHFELVDVDEPDFKKGEIVTIIPHFNCGTCIACRSGTPGCTPKLEALAFSLQPFRLPSKIIFKKYRSF